MSRIGTGVTRSCCNLLVPAALLATTLAAAPAASSAPPTLPAGLLDASADKVLSRIVVPDPSRRVGEVRLIARGGAVVVQTLLSTKVLARVVAEIHKKEEAAWPPGSATSADSRDYLEALDALLHDLETHQPAVTWAERRRRMLIEFVADDSSAGVILGGWDGDDVDGALNPAERKAMKLLVPARQYVLRNMRLILIDSFHVADADLDRLGALGPLRGVVANAPPPIEAPADPATVPSRSNATTAPASSPP